MNQLTKRRAAIALAFSITLTGTAAYVGIQQGSYPDTEEKQTAVAATQTVDHTDAINVTAGLTSQMFEEDVAVTENEGNLVAQGLDEEVSSETTGQNEDANTIYGYKNLGIAQVEGNLNVRKKASTDSKVVGKMTNGDACEIISVKDGWAEITSGKVKGYVKTEYLMTGDAAEKAANEEAATVVTVNTTTLRVRKHASEDSAIVSLVGQGEDLVVEKSRNGWYKVEVDDQKGYISGDYVDVSKKLPTASEVTELESGNGYTDTRVSLVQFALQYVGNRYVWGGTSLTNGIDCSGFTMQVYARYGVGLPHHAASQPGCGTRISASEAKPGDLFFYGSGSSISHVGIYIGNGQIVHASNARTGIKISSAYYRTPICVVSYLQ